MDAEQTNDLTVAVTGPTGTFGHALMPHLERDERIGRVVGVARRPFDPQSEGWSKMTYRQGDVRDPAALEEAFAGADVVVHLAFLIVGGRGTETRDINVEGTLNAFRAAAEAGAKRFVYASSLAAYGFHRDNPVGMTEDHPVRPADALFYAQEKAELESLLSEEAARHPEVDLYLLRPPIVLGPHFVGGKADVPGVVSAPLTAMARGMRKLPVGPPVPVPTIPVQLVHQDDVATALLACVTADGPPGAYNIAADDVLSAVQIAREVGLTPIPVPGEPAHAAARLVSQLVAKVPFLPGPVQWIEAAAHPAVMDTSKAKEELGWAPRHTSLDALRDSLP